MKNPRIPNFKIEENVKRFAEFDNYNRTITAHRGDTYYIMWHWSTEILAFNIETQQIEKLTWQSISQTTSTLVGRILRSLPRESVVDYLHTLKGTIPQRDLTRLVKMARL